MIQLRALTEGPHETCKYGSKCYNEDFEHLSKNRHLHRKFTLQNDKSKISAAVEILLPRFLLEMDNFQISPQELSNCNLESKDEGTILIQLRILSQLYSSMVGYDQTQVQSQVIFNILLICVNHLGKGNSQS